MFLLGSAGLNIREKSGQKSHKKNNTGQQCLSLRIFARFEVANY
jgi:hypothetical protein